MDRRTQTWLNQVDGGLRHKLPRPLYTAMLQGYHVGRMVTRRNPGRGRVLPDLVIIGAAKCGTTSVYAWLCEHPDVKRPRRKEIDYFSVYHYRGNDWYRHHFPLSSERAAFAAEHGRPFITGEASPSYMLDEDAPRRMAQLIPAVKLIVQLRNPADRAYSQFQMRRRTGHEPLESFAKALEIEDPSFAGGSGTPAADEWRTYLKRGRYAEQLERWLHYFPREQFHVLALEDLHADPQAALCDLHEFLELAPHLPQQLQPRFTADYEPMRSDTRARLCEYFRPHNERLFELLGKEFAWNE
jgi:hypothetical protein